MTITRIENLTKTKVRVIIDEEMRWTLSVSDIRDLGLYEDMELSTEVYESIYQEYVLKRAMTKALNLLEHRDHTRKELEDKLYRAGFPAEAVQGAVDYVEGYHYIDDERYLRNYMSYKTAGKSRQIIYQTLVSKGIDTEIIRESLEDSEIDDVENIKQLYHRKFGDIIAISQEKKRKIFNYFLRKGYKYNDIANAIKDFDSN